MKKVALNNSYLECYIMVSLIGQLHGARTLPHYLNCMYKKQFRHIARQFNPLYSQQKDLRQTNSKNRAHK